VLQRHHGDADVLAASTACLSAMATNPKYAAALIDSGAMMGMLDSVIKNPLQGQGVTESLNLLETIASNNPEALLAGGGADASTRLIAAASSNATIVGAAVRTLEKLNKVPGGATALIECDAIKTVVNVAVKTSSDSDTLEASFRLLERMARSPDHAEYIRTECKGMEVLSAALEANTEPRVQKVGGRLLSKLASGSVSDLIIKFDSTAVASEKEFLSSLLANLALEEENCSKIVQSGGVAAIVNAFNGGSKKTIESSTRALGRLAVNDEAAEEIFRSGALTVLVRTMEQYKNDASTTATIAQAVRALVSSSERADKVMRNGGIEAVLKAFAAHPEFEALSLAALQLLDELASFDFDVARLQSFGVVDAANKALKAHGKNAGVQLGGLRALIFFSFSEANANSMVAAGAVERCLALLDHEKKDVVVAAMYLATSLVILPAGKGKLGAKGIETLLAAVSKYATDPIVKDTAEELLDAIVTEEQVQSATADFGAALESLLASKNKANAAQVKALAATIGAYCVSANYAQVVVEADGLANIVKCIEECTTSAGMPELEGIMTACSRALSAIVGALGDNAEMRAQIVESGAIKGVVTSVKLHPKLKLNVAAAMGFIDTMAQREGDKVTEDGGVESCVAALRANTTNVEIVSSAFNTLLQLAASDEGAVAVARHGGSRQVMATVTANASTPNFSGCLEAAVALMQRISQTSEGADALIKQGALDMVIAATETLDKLGVAVPDAARVLARLLTKEDVESAVAQIGDLGGNAARGRVPGADAIAPVLAKLGHMTTVAAFSQTIATKGGALGLANLARGVLSKADDDNLKNDVLPGIFKAVANLSALTKLDDALGFPTFIGEAINGGFAVAECLECIKSIAQSSEHSAYQLCMDGSTLSMVVETLRANIRNKDITTACFNALASLASHNSTAGIVAATAAQRLVSDWVDDNIDDAAPETLEGALGVLANMARSPEHANAMLASGGIIELVKAVLTKACIEAKAAAPAVLAGAASVLLRVGNSPSAIYNIAASGVLRRVVRAMTVAPEYMRDEACVLKVIELFKACAGVPQVLGELQVIGAEEIILSGMNGNGTSAECIKNGAAALQALGAGAENARAAQQQVTMLSAQLQVAPEITEDMINHLGDAVQRLGNYMMIEGVVNGGNAPAIMAAISNAVALLNESGVAQPTQLAAGVHSIGRLVEMGGRAVESTAKEAVEMVLEVLQQAGHESIVREATVNTLGQLAGSSAGLDAITSLGAIEQISRVGRAYAADSKLQAIVSASLKKITSQTSASATRLIASGGAASSATIMAVVAANSSDKANLSAMLSQVATVSGGDETIYDVISKPGTSADVIGEALRVLKENSDAAGGRPVAGNARRVAGLNKALATTMHLQSQLTAHSDQRAKMLALRMAENTLVLLTRIGFDPVSAGAFFAAGSIENLLALLSTNIEDEETVGKVTAILKGALQYCSPPVGLLVAKSEHMNTIKGTLQLFDNNAVISADCCEVLASVARAAGADACGIDREGMRTMSEAQQRFPADARIRAALQNLQVVMGAKFSENDAAVRAMTASLQQAAATIAAVGTIQEMTNADGQVYYYDSRTGATEWTAPQAYQDFKAAMAATSALAAAQGEDSVVRADPSTISSMVGALTAHVRNPTVSGAAAQTLATLAFNDANAEEIARLGGIRAIIASVSANANDASVVRSLLALLERISRNPVYKDQVADQGGMEAVLDVALVRHQGVEEVALKALSCLANLAFNSDRNIKTLMARNVVGAVDSCLKRYSKAPRVLENAMCVLSNLMFGSDENKLEIGKKCAAAVVSIVRDLPQDANLFKMALRALGNLSFCDENIRMIVETHHATKAIVVGMRAHPKADDLQHVAIEVLGNFASLEDEAPEVDAEGNQVNQRDSIQALILREQGTAQIIASLKTYASNSSIVKAALDALASIANDSEVTEMMVEKQNLVVTVIDVMQSNDWDLEIVSRCVTLIAVMTYAKDVLKAIAQNDGITMLLSAMEQHGSSQPVLASAQLALTNLATSEEARTQLRNMDGVSILLSLFETNMGNKEFVAESLKTMTRLCADDSLSKAIAADGMHLLLQAVDRYDEPGFLTTAFRLLGHLAFVESNLTIIVQHNGIQRVISAISAFPDHLALMVRCIQTLDNIAMANKENAAIVIDEGGMELIETIKETYPDSGEIQKAGNSALLSLKALENLAKSADITAKAARLGKLGGNKTVIDAMPAKDALSDHRGLLKSGKVLTVWSKGSSVAAHVLVSPDWKSIVWQEIKAPQKKLGAIDLRNITGVKSGMSEGHKKGMLSMSKACDPDNAFSLTADRNPLDLEAGSARERDNWVKALSALMQMYKSDPASLK
jgi:hypothetical protein